MHGFILIFCFVFVYGFAVVYSFFSKIGFNFLFHN